MHHAFAAIARSCPARDRTVTQSRCQAVTLILPCLASPPGGALGELVCPPGAFAASWWCPRAAASEATAGCTGFVPVADCARATGSGGIVMGGGTCGIVEMAEMVSGMTHSAAR